MINRLHIGSIGLWLAAIGCGGPQSEKETGTSSGPAVVQPVDRAPEKTYTTAEIAVEDKDAGFQLASADSYNAVIDGCLSGYAKALDESDTTAQVQNGDVSCAFRILDLTYLGETFTPSGGQDWSAGQSFNVTGSLGTRMNFFVSAQLDSPILTTQSIGIQFGAAQEGISQVAGADVATGITITGADPVNLTPVELHVSVDGTDGAGLFDFTFECDSPVTGSGALAECDGQNLSDLKFGIQLDTFGGGPLELDECRSIVSGGTGGTVFDQGTDPSYPNGGIDSGDLKGPATLYNPANGSLIAAVAEGTADTGCKYFRITVTQP